MTRLTDLRQIDTPEGPAMTADFTAPDGRMGSVAVLLSVFEQQGERALQQEADAIVRASRLHGYRPPEADRFNELG
jgi:hypothetical protein